MIVYSEETPKYPDESISFTFTSVKCDVLERIIWLFAYMHRGLVILIPCCISTCRHLNIVNTLQQFHSGQHHSLFSSDVCGKYAATKSALMCMLIVDCVFRCSYDV